MKKILILQIFCLLGSYTLTAQSITNNEIRNRIVKYKADTRGPYKEIRWYCPDGSIIPPNERCPEPGGVQRARHKDEVSKLAETNHIYLGQILATTQYDLFWDAEVFNSRTKQFQLEKYLRAIDNGWVLQKAQYYRGAYQVEDEELWGINYFNWLLADKQILEKQYFLMRESAKDIPHMGDDNLKQNVRLLSKEISEVYAPFLDIRVKIHGQPENTDIQKVRDFREKHEAKMSKEILLKMDELLQEMEKQFKPFDISSINRYISVLPKDAGIHKFLTEFQNDYKSSTNVKDKIELLSSTIYEIRKSIIQVKSPKARLALLDISVILEDLLFKVISAYQPVTLEEQINTIYNLGIAATGCGYLELWEWEELKQRLEINNNKNISETELVQIFESCRNITEWGTAMFLGIYEDVVNLYSGFEPLASGFIDEKVRASLLLQIGTSVNLLSENLSAYLPFSNKIMGIAGSSASRGLNPGIAKGELVVITGSAENLNFDKNKIYVFNKPPSDLKPVAGIATVSEGNPVSHIQLLARNLGIPNAVISMQNLEDLKKYSGKMVFYAVSSKGVVIMKPEEEMDVNEKQLFEKGKREEIKIAVPIDKLDLNQKQILNLKSLNASSSGKLCGPKAANLGQLKQIFPENVVDGLVIPFGIFREHLNQPMPGQSISYWEYLNKIFSRSSAMKSEGATEAEIEIFMLKELAIMGDAIKKIQFTDKFNTDLHSLFKSVLKSELGSIPVFLRSDTNMEDLKEFTGAGLNLTLFNVLSEDMILQGIRDVWASPYTERSYKWRQRYLTNPENVYPSILIIPSVNVNYSGVMVTKGVGQGSEDDITIAFSLGVGGAVDGQSAESYILKSNGENILLSPSRESSYKELPAAGGTSTNYASFEKPILNEKNIEDIRKLSRKVKTTLPNTPGIETKGPFDVELGFMDNKLWLFQVRPFVENKNAASQLYLESLNPTLSSEKIIDLNETIIK